MVDHEAKAKQFLIEAEEKLNVTKGLCCKGKAKIEEACDLYVRAANSFKMAKNWGAAGNAFAEAAAMQLKNDRKHEAGTSFVDASKCYKKVNHQDSVNCLLKATEVYIDMGRQKVAAKHHMAAAEIYEFDLKDLQSAVMQYQMAADLFVGEESTSSANKCLLNVAKYSALLEDYQKAIDIYEKIGQTSLDSALLKYSANDMFVRAAVCQMCIDVRKTPSAIDRYEERSPAFGNSRECQLVRQMAERAIENDLDGFNEAIRSYESVMKLDPWYGDIFRRIRKIISAAPDLR